MRPLTPQSSTGTSTPTPTVQVLRVPADGETLTLTYQVTVDDGVLNDQTTVEINITGTNDQPTITGVLTDLSATDEDTSIEILEADLLQGISDPDSSDQISIGNITATKGQIAPNGAGKWTFTPDLNVNSSDGDATIEYEVVDNHGLSTTARRTSKNQPNQ